MGRSASDLLAILHQLLDPSDPGERRSHRANTPRTNLLSMLSQAEAGFDAGAAHMHDHLESLRHHADPFFSQPHSLLLGEHIALTR